MATTVSAQPQYQIFDIGVIQQTDTASQGIRASHGGIAVGRVFQSNASQAYSWTVGGGIVGLPNLSGRAYAVANDANDKGIVVGTAADTFFGSNRLPVMWQNGQVTQLPLPPGESIGDATGVNSVGIIVGSVDGGSLQQGCIYKGPASAVITETTSTGCTFVTAFGINDSGRIVGFGIDPNNAARNVGIVLDFGQTTAFEVGAIPGANGAIAFGVGNGGHVVGSTMMNQGSGTPFIWSDADGIRAIPLATGTSEGSARAVNSSGWVVGQDSSAFSIPFLWDGTTTYRLADLLPAGSGWDLSMNTSSSAEGISDAGVIVGTGVHNGETHAYAMVPVQGTPTPSPTPTPTTPPPTATPGVATHFSVSAPGDVLAGAPFNFTVTAQDKLNNTVTNYSGTVHFTTTASSHSLPPDSTLTNGTGTFSATIGDMGGDFTITATDTVTPSITGTSNIIHVTPFEPPTPTPTPVPATHFTVDAPDIVFVGKQPFSFTVTARDALNQTATGYAGTVHFTSDGIATLPGDSTLTNGVGTFEAGPFGLGTWTITATDTVNPSITGTSNPIEVYGEGQPTPTPTPSPSPSATSTPTPPNRALNVSTRLFVQTGNNAGIGGFIVTGTAPKLLLFRGIGPSLGSVGVQDALADPTLDLRDSKGGQIQANDNWRDLQEQEIIQTGLAPTNDLEAAILVQLDPGSYTVILRGANNSTGVGLVEIYDVDHGTDSKLGNLSTRAFVQTGNNVVIAGFILDGLDNDSIVVRGIGPSLTAFGVPDALPDPSLELRDSNGALVNQNNDWQDDPSQASFLSTFGLAPTNDLESGLFSALPPGAYTAVLFGRNNGTGIGVVEIYDLGAQTRPGSAKALKR